MFNKPIEVWIAIIAAALYVFESNNERAFFSRLLMTLCSAALGLSLMADLSQYTGLPETITGLLVTAFGYIVLEIGTALVKDRDFVKEVIRKKFGGDK